MASYGDVSFVTTDDTSSIKGLQFPVKTTNTGGMFSRNLDARSIKEGLLQLLMTQRGERPMRLDFGTDVRTSVFAPMDSQLITSLRQSILSAIDLYEPRVIVRDLQISPDEANSRVTIELAFSIKNNVFYKDTIVLTVDNRGVQING